MLLLKKYEPTCPAQLIKRSSPTSYCVYHEPNREAYIIALAAIPTLIKQIKNRRICHLEKKGSEEGEESGGAGDIQSTVAHGGSTAVIVFIV